MKRIIYTVLSGHLVVFIFIGAKYAMDAYFGFDESFDESQIQSIGQVLSSMDIACGVITYFQAGKGKPSYFLLLAPLLAAPIYFSLGGPLRTVFLYILIAIVIQGLALFRYHKHRLTRQTNEP